MSLEKPQAEARKERVKLNKELTNAQRRRSRLRKRAKLLTNEDLDNIRLMRKERQTQAEPSTKGVKH